jgi:uncharacterized protein (TIGR02246 family)
MKAVAATLTLALVLAVAAARGQQKTDPALNRLTMEFVAAVNAKDAAKTASFYTDDAVIMPPDEKMVKGRRDIEAYYKRGFMEDVGEVTITPDESATAGSLAFEAGTSVATHGVGAALLGGRPAVPERGKYVVVYKRVGGDWKIAYDIFNND